MTNERRLLQMISSHREGPGWATAHLAQMTTQMEKEASPTPISSAVAPTAPPLQDLDAPLNLTKPKSSSSGATASSSSPGSDSHSTGAGSSGQQEQPVAATAPKLFPPGLPMPRNYLTTLPYAGLPPHLSTLSSPSKRALFFFFSLFHVRSKYLTNEENLCGYTTFLMRFVFFAIRDLISWGEKKTEEND